MASVSTEAGNRRRIVFTAPDGKRKSLRLGKCSKRSAEQVKFRVEKLLESKRTGHALDATTADWLADVDDVMADRLARAGLAAPRQKREETGLGAFLDDYVSKRIDVKPATKEVWSHPIRNLKNHFEEDRDIVTITPGDCEDFKLFLIGAKLSATTVSKRLQFARMFFRDARKRKLVAENPFQEVSHKAINRPERRHFLPRKDVDRLMEVCDPMWQTIVALCRYAGLRCQSEVLSLRWVNVN